MDLEPIGKFISTIGFPVAVAMYLLMRIEPILRAMNENLIKLTALIDHKLKDEDK